jgi:hypothetical protein
MSEWLATLVSETVLPMPASAFAMLAASAEAVRLYSNSDGERRQLWLLASTSSKQSAVQAIDQLSGALKGCGGTRLVAAIGHSLGVFGSQSTEPSRYLLPVPMAVPDSDLQELDRWYCEEHVGLLLRAPCWTRVERYTVDQVVGAEWTRLTLHSVERHDSLMAPEVRHAMSTAWRNALALRPWFLAGGRNMLVIAKPN